VLGPVQWFGAHCEPAKAVRHFPVPSHVDRQAPPAPHCARGSTPSGTIEHLPGEVGSAHDSHVPLHALSQQTPSTQKPEEHSAAELQLWKSPFTVGLLPASSIVTGGVLVSGVDVSGIAVSGAPVSKGPVSKGPVSTMPVSAGPVSAGPVSAGPVSGGPLSTTGSTQALPMQVFPVAQSASPAHVVLQPVAAHA
jgi:hypothetical protein